VGDPLFGFEVLGQTSSSPRSRRALPGPMPGTLHRRATWVERSGSRAASSAAACCRALSRFCR
jgi:hypothetical protein